MDEEHIVLSYENSLLYEADVNLLEPPGWINDSIIEFVLEYFANEQFEAISEDICFIAPQVSQFLKLCQGRTKEEICDFLEPLDLPDKKYIIVPINNSVSHFRTGGTHWHVTSTMVYSKDDGKIFYLDSLSDYNKNHAIMVQKKIGIHLQAFVDAPIESVPCPQQTNSHDCGLYAICFAEEICKGLQEKRKEFYKVTFNADHAADTRERIKKLIFSLVNR